MSERKKITFEKNDDYSKVQILIYASININYYTLIVFTVHNYTFKYGPGEICTIYYVFCQLQVSTWQCSHFHQHYD